MTRPGWTVAFFPTLAALVDAFTSAAPAVEQQAAESGGRSVEVNAWGDSPLGRSAVEHAAETAATIAREWYSTRDPREPADWWVAELVRDIWWQALSYLDDPRLARIDEPPGTFEERPETIPRVDGVRYYPAVSLAGTLTVPDGCTVTVAVREDTVDDRDYDHLFATADPAGFDPELGHEADVAYADGGPTR